MSDSDDTWEEFFGPSTELMPSIMHALDGILDGREDALSDNTSSSREDLRATPPPRKVYQANNFANLSFNVQKILSHVSDQEIINKRFVSEESLPHKRPNAGKCKRSSPEKALYKSNESLELISPNVQKMLSNLPDTELVISNSSADDKKVKRNSSFLHARKDSGKLFVVHKTQDENRDGDENDQDGCDRLKAGDSESGSAEDSFTSKPLGSYMHTSPSGIASRTPVGRKNMGKYLQVPSESSVGTNSTTSSEVSRPVSLTSLGSCSSSGSSGTHQPGSAYQASAESLDSDPEPSGIQGSADSGIAEEPTAICRKEYDVVAEIIDTETKYVEDLHKVIQDYLEPWRVDPDCALQEHLPHLFSNLEAIHEFNNLFLMQLREAKLDPSLTAKVFINNSGFSIYTDYCTHYPKTLTVLTELMGNEETARYFREVQLQKNHDLPLGSYLLKPVQRILRYRLLLERLSEMCKPEHKPVVDLALTTMTGVAFHINSMKRKHENAVRIQEIQSQLYGWDGPDLTTLGELIAEGTFRVGGVKGRRHVFLFDKLLLLTKCKHDGTITYKSHIMCSNLMLVEQVRGEPLSFHVLPFDNPRLQCTLRARSPQHKREWTGQLKRVIIENYNAEIPNHAQQLLMQLGQDPPEKEESSELWTPLKQHSTPQYLERRTRVRKSRDFSTRRAASHDRSFPSLGSWRRKSEPNVVQQYDTKTVPSRISKIKKAKESTATFYTDLSDSETCDIIDEAASTRSQTEHDEVVEQPKTVPNDDDDDDVQGPKTQGKIVSDLIMQNEEFHKAISRRNRNLRESETDPNICIKLEKDPISTKADSLPRSFQLNDQIDNSSSECLDKSEISLKAADVEVDPDISSQLNNNDHPEHKIYRKSAIRFSLLQRYHAIKDRHKKSTAKQVSKIIGARIANPDYEDPQKLFSSPQFLSQSTMSISSSQEVDFDAPEDLDLTINENEVLTEFDKRMHKSQEELHDDCKKSSQNHSASTSEICTTVNKQVFNRCSSDIITSSQNSDSYYESLLEKTLNDEVNIEKCDSFRTTVTHHKYSEKITATSSENTTGAIRSPLQERKSPQRPTKAPPPIPAKPARFLNTDNISTSLKYSSTNVASHSSETYTRISKFTKRENSSTSKISEISSSERIQSKGWVKTIVGRFE